MKHHLSFVLAGLATIGFFASVVRDSGSEYQPRSSSQIDEVLKHQRPGGKIAAGMAEYFNALRVNPVTGIVSEEDYMAAVNASLKMQTKRTVNSVWNELGPDNVGGRTRAFLQDKDTPSLMFVGSVSGGLFRSTTRGSSWIAVNDFQENLNVNCIAQTANGTIVYGTGEGEFVSITGTHLGTPGFAGAGIFRSTDRGRTFTRINATSGYGNINSMASYYGEGKNIVYASTSGALRKSTDDGLTWTVARSGNSKEVKVATNGMVVAQSASNIVKSTDDGNTWTVITPPGAGIARASIAISPQDPDYIYVMVSGGNSTLGGVWRSTNAGNTWDKIVNQATIHFDPLSNALQGQGNFNNVLTVNPLDKNHIIMGGVYLAEWKLGMNPRYIASLNDLGGSNSAYVHADKHVLQWDMTTTPPTMICGTDGGLYYSSDNLRTFQPKNQGFNATQFYAVAADYEGNVAGGTQDNGTQYINKKGNTKKAAVEIKGGDGFQTEISVKDNSVIFAETYYGNLTRSRDYGKSQSCIWDRRIARSFIGLNDTSKFCEHNHRSNWAPFNTKIRLWEHPDFTNDESRLFIAVNGAIWMGTGVTDFLNDPVWYRIATAHGGGIVWDLEPTPDGNSLFITNNNSIYRVDGLNSATYDKWSNPLDIPPGITITNLNFTAGGGRSISSICLDPNDANTALITLGNYGYSNYIYKGSNMLGTPTYTNITNNLPSMPVYDGVIALSNSNLMFLATDLGVYASDDGGATWTSQTNPANKFPKVATMAIRQYIFPARNRGSIYAGTHGRGFFECQQYKTNINTVLNKNGNVQTLSAYPNPASDQVHFSFENTKGMESVTFNVYDFTGKIVLVKVVAIAAGKNDVSMDVSQLRTGTYIVSGTGNNGNRFGTVKLVIRN